MMMMMTPMDAVITGHQADSIAAELALPAGTRVISVNGRSDLQDLFDWRYELADTEALELHVRYPDGMEEIFEIEKDPDEDPGFVFGSPLFTPIKTCNNRCPFCFIDQQPEGLRPSLYVKDDDWRLSYFSNTYITLTNLTQRDKARIEMLRPGPLYVSVHATEPAVRTQLLQNPKAPPILEMLGWLKSLEIPFHCQVVICPGINDGEVLSQTLKDLSQLRPEMTSIAVVPLGITQWREQLTQLTPVDTQSAAAVIDRVEAFQAKTPAARDYVFLSDEFYFKAGRPLPDYGQYGEFPQLDDGVGSAQHFAHSFWQLEESLPQALTDPRRFLLITGKLAASVLGPIAGRLNQIENLWVDICPIESKFWGETADVAGLITGQDILQQLSGTDVTGYAAALVPDVMLKAGEARFLDDVQLSELAETLRLPVTAVNHRDASALLAAVLN